MAEDLGGGAGGGLPPKLDLRKSGVLKPTPVAAKPVPAVTPKPVEAATPAPVVVPESAPVVTPKPVPTTVKPAAVKPVAAAGTSPLLTPKPVPTTVKPVGVSPAADPSISVADKSETMRLVIPDDGTEPSPAPVKPVSALKPVPTLKPSPAAPLAPKPAQASVLSPKPAAPAAPAAGDASQEDALSQTMRLVVPEAEGDSASAAEAKTLLKTPPVKTTIKPPAPNVIKDPKRETSKIPLDAAKPAPASEAAGPKTIRISPASKVAAVKPAAPVAASASNESDKRKTSRISLEAALAPGDDGAAPGAPKTIKIKKPSDASTIKAVKGPSIKAAIDDLSKTARLDEASEDDAAGPVTRKKTIKVKRPTQRPGVQRTVQTVRPGTEASESVAAPQATGPGVVAAGAPMPMMQVEEKMNPFFPICAIIAALILLVAIYMFCAQALGPNVSLTELSYWPTGPDLPWPGKLKGYLLQP